MLSALQSRNHLDLATLRKKKEEKDARRKEAYDLQLLKCHQRIQTTCEMGHDNVFCKVKAFEFGQPRIHNYRGCLMYIIYNLRQDGLNVQFIHPDTLFISWEEQQKPRRNAFRQLPAAPAYQPVQTVGTVRESVRPRTMEEKVMDVTQTVYKPPVLQQEERRDKVSSGTVYDDDVMSNLKFFNDRVKKKRLAT